MPWKRTDPMEGRMRLVMEVESEVFQMSELCERYGVSRKTGYKWLERYRKEGVAGLQDRSRAPLHCPHRTPEAIRLVMEVESEVFQMSELCERVSRKTGYKWLERYRKEGVAGLQDRSRAPLLTGSSAALAAGLSLLLEAKSMGCPGRL